MVLVFRNVRKKNIASLAKLSWSILTNKEDLWVRVLKGKYLSNGPHPPWPVKNSKSHIWKSISIAQASISNAIKWIIGNGSSVKLWDDWCCGSTNLMELIDNNITSLLLDVKVSDVITDSNCWDFYF